jgi:hypothetical protein
LRKDIIKFRIVYLINANINGATILGPGITTSRQGNKDEKENSKQSLKKT